MAESIEQLAEQIVSQYVGGAYLDGCIRDCREKIEEWLRACGIDPAGVKPIAQQAAGGEGAKEPEQEINKPDMLRRLMDEWRTSTGKKQDELMETILELCFPDETIGGIALTLVAPTPHPESGERDGWMRKCGVEISHHFEGDTFHDYTPGDVANIIAKHAAAHLAAERAEAERVKVDREELREAWVHQVEKNKALTTRLAATEAKLREAEEIIVKARRHFYEGGRVCNGEEPYPQPPNAE